MGEAFVKGLVTAIFIGFISLIIWGIKWLRFQGREKLDNEVEKNEYLQNKFKHLVNTKEGKKIIKDILVIQPLKKSKPWKVIKLLKWGTWPINDNEKEEVIYEVLDSSLENDSNYHNFLNKISSEKNNILQ